MMADVKSAWIERTGDGVAHLHGAWVLATSRAMRGAMDAHMDAASLDCSGIEALDTAGALVLYRLSELTGAELIGLQEEFTTLFGEVNRLLASGRTEVPFHEHGILHRIGLTTVGLVDEIQRYLAFLGELAVAAAGVARRPSRIRWRATLSVFETGGWGALPILGLLSFLIGVVVAYQAGVQLRDFGANIFIADLIGISVLREFGPLLTAIIVAGRTGSAFTAEIGTMKVTEEIDALRTIGVSPLELLVLPKVVALVIVLPLLTVFASIFGVLGGMVMAQQMLDVSTYDFIDRFLTAVDLSDYLTGVGKAPVFALLIASVGCFQGFQVGASADSVGRHTTRSVVQAIFLIIVADAGFSVAFNMLGL